MFIVFMGLDGTGKSTQSAQLKKNLLESGEKPVIIHHGSPVFRPAKWIKAIIRDPLINFFKMLKVHRDHDKADYVNNIKSRQRTNLFGRLISRYIVLFGFFKTWFHYLLYKRRGLIYDRCFLDDIVKARWRFGANNKVGSFLIHYIPIPKACIVFRIPVETSYSRKKAKNCTLFEYRMKEVYFDEALQMAQKYGWCIREINIENLSISEVSRKVQFVLR